MTDTALDISALEELDFDAEFPCEHSQHKENHHPDEPAKFLVAFRCTDCMTYNEYLMCEPGVRWMLESTGFICPYCDADLENSREFFFVIGPIQA